MAKLTDTRCRTLKAPGEYCDSGCTGLILRVTPALTKNWMFRAVIGGKRRKLGLGAYPAVSLQEARKRAEVNREQIASGLDPMAEKRKAEAMAAIPTFAEASAKAVDVRFSDWQSNAHAVEWMGSLQRHAFPKLGTMTVDTNSGFGCLVGFAADMGRNSRHRCACSQPDFGRHGMVGFPWLPRHQPMSESGRSAADSETRSGPPSGAGSCRHARRHGRD